MGVEGGRGRVRRPGRRAGRERPAGSGRRSRLAGVEEGRQGWAGGRAGAGEEVAEARAVCPHVHCWTHTPQATCPGSEAVGVSPGPGSAGFRPHPHCPQGPQQLPLVPFSGDSPCCPSQPRSRGGVRGQPVSRSTARLRDRAASPITARGHSVGFLLSGQCPGSPVPGGRREPGSIAALSAHRSDTVFPAEAVSSAQSAHAPPLPAPPRRSLRRTPPLLRGPLFFMTLIGTASSSFTTPTSAVTGLS